MNPLLLALPLASLAAEPGSVTFEKKGVQLSDASGDNTLTLGLSLQPRAVLSLDGDPDASDADQIAEAGFRLRRALFLASGTVAGRFDYRFRVDGARTLVFNDGDGKSQTAQRAILDDAQVVWRLSEPVALAFGQWKVPFTASRMASDTTLLFLDRPILVEGVRFGDVKWSGWDWSREAGVAALGSLADKRVEAQLGVFNGDGANVWPPDDGPLAVARVAVHPLGAFSYDEVDLKRGDPRLSLGASATLENTPGYDDQGARADDTRDLRAGGELRFAARGLSLNAEAVLGWLGTGEADPTRGLGAYAQVGYVLPHGIVPGVRWSRLDPSLDAEDDGVSTVEGVLNLFAPDPGKPGELLGHGARLQLGWTTALQDGLEHPLYHQAQLGAVLGF